jgi:hypothetical protein
MSRTERKMSDHLVISNILPISFSVRVEREPIDFPYAVLPTQIEHGQMPDVSISLLGATDSGSIIEIEDWQIITPIQYRVRRASVTEWAYLDRERELRKGIWPNARI